MLASRRPRHPVGWPLLAQVAANLATGAAGQYLAWGLLAGGPLPATRYVALSYPASAGGGLLLLGFVLLLLRERPRGVSSQVPELHERKIGITPFDCPCDNPDREAALAWLALVARAMVAVPRLLQLVTLAPGSVDTSQQVLGSPFDFGRLAQAKVDPGCCQLPVVSVRRAGWSGKSGP